MGEIVNVFLNLSFIYSTNKCFCTYYVIGQLPDWQFSSVDCGSLESLRPFQGIYEAKTILILTLTAFLLDIFINVAKAKVGNLLVS